ncbi:hypothetical protein [Nonomuraea soli]|uniref:Uncharacterized protein n=1 Tax=Nonomuraea soli TaxID=1032476 RepID=A0A7W0HTL9_9ACTN|nr:hypothetical protein [Nonomuraea soli]MBA2894836.1 hypothetical protein [Nonomuraea soli]
MLLVDRECVRRLMESPDPDATLVFVRGECLVLPAGEIDEAHRGLIVGRQEEIARLMPAGDLTDERLDLLAHRLDNVVRDLGG